MSKRVFFYRICGTGMGAAACLLRQKGYHVEGGDNVFYPPMSTYLKQSGIPCHQLTELTPEFLQQFDLIVVGNVVPRGSADAQLIEGLGVPYMSFPRAIGELVLKDIPNVVGIAGTHGKTTTTYLITQLFENLGMNPGYLIGGVLEGRAPAQLGSGDYFFIEADEYDSAYFEKISKFRLYQLNHMILTSLEFDHGDIFKDIEAIKDQFRVVMGQIKGTVIVTEDYPAANELVEEFSGSYSRFGEQSNVGPQIESADHLGTNFRLKLGAQSVAFQTNLVGKHNILNLSGAILFAIQQGIAVDKIRLAITDLKMVKRRQELRGSYRKALVIDDFAHHPRAVQMTIEAIHGKYPEKQLVVVLEPNSATARSNLFQKEFAQSLMGADLVIMARPKLHTTIKHLQDLDCQQIVDQLNQRKVRAYLANQLDQLRTLIDQNVNVETVLLILSNGTCLGLWESDFVDELV